MQTTTRRKPPEATGETEQLQPAEQVETTYRVKVTQRHALTLPAELRHAFDIEDGDEFDIQIDGDHLVLRRARSDAVARLEGILSPYFKDREDVQRFIDEERQGWIERDAFLEEIWERAERARDQNGT